MELAQTLGLHQNTVYNYMRHNSIKWKYSQLQVMVMQNWNWTISLFISRNGDWNQAFDISLGSYDRTEYVYSTTMLLNPCKGLITLGKSSIIGR